MPGTAMVGCDPYLMGYSCIEPLDAAHAVTCAATGPIHVLHKEPGRTSTRVRAVVDYLAQRLRTDPALAS